jgi:S-adenosylmethionine:tRNA ribosyltransferase-isomerase
MIGQQSVVLHARYIEKESDSFLIEFSWDHTFPFAEVIHAAGNIPLPPISREK